MRHGLRLEFGQQPASKTHAACLRGDPHALDLHRCATRQLQARATDRLTVQPRHEEQPVRRAQFAWIRQRAARRVESGIEAFVQFGVVRAEAPLRVGVIGVCHVDGDGRGSQQPLDLGHRRNQPRLLGVVERGEQ